MNTTDDSISTANQPQISLDSRNCLSSLNANNTMATQITA